MRAHRIKVVIDEDHEIRAKLPSDFPAGSAEVIVISEATVGAEVAHDEAAQDFSTWLAALLRRVPRGPGLPDVIDRASFYDD